MNKMAINKTKREDEGHVEVDLCEEVKRGHKAEEPEEGVEHGDLADPLPMDGLHGAVVDAVQRQVHEEDGQEVVGGAGGAAGVDGHRRWRRRTWRWRKINLMPK